MGRSDQIPHRLERYISFSVLKNNLYLIILRQLKEQFIPLTVKRSFGIPLEKLRLACLVESAEGQNILQRGIRRSMQKHVVVVKGNRPLRKIHGHAVPVFPLQDDLVSLLFIGQGIVFIPQISVIHQIEQITPGVEFNPGKILHTVHKIERKFRRGIYRPNIKRQSLFLNLMFRFRCSRKGHQTEQQNDCGYRRKDF